jgi:hypothetical protein
MKRRRMRLARDAARITVAHGKGFIRGGRAAESRTFIVYRPFRLGSSPHVPTDVLHR